MLRYLTERLPAMITPRWLRTRTQPIAIRDVLYYLVRCADLPPGLNHAFDIGGPDVLEYGDMMQIYAELAGLRRRRMLVLPVLTPRIAALWVGLVTPIPSGLARPLVESLHCDAVMANHDIDTIIDALIGAVTYRRLLSHAPLDDHFVARLLSTVLDETLRALHPFIPFVTEEIYKNFDAGSIVVAAWPKVEHELSSEELAAFASAHLEGVPNRHPQAIWEIGRASCRERVSSPV